MISLIRGVRRLFISLFDRSEQRGSSRKLTTNVRLKHKNNVLIFFSINDPFQTLKIQFMSHLFLYIFFFTVSLCNKSRVQQRKTKVM